MFNLCMLIYLLLPVSLIIVYWLQETYFNPLMTKIGMPENGEKCAFCFAQKRFFLVMTAGV